MSGKQLVRENELIYKSIEELNKIVEKVDIVINTRALCKQYCNSANQIYKKAEIYYQNGDKEKAYILYMRYINIYKKIRESYEFNKDKNAFLSILKECNPRSGIERAEYLSGCLEKRYTELAELQSKNQKKNSLGVLKDQVDLILPDVPTDFKVRPLSNTTIDKEKENTPAKQEVDKINNSSNMNTIKKSCSFISVNELYGILKDCKNNHESTLIIDVRPNEEYDEARICYQCMINVPENILKPGANVNTIEMKLSKQTWEIWRSRFEKEKVIVIDYNFNESLFAQSCPVKVLFDALLKFDGRFELFIVLGGFKEWHLAYPSLTTNPTYCKLPQNLALEQDPLSLIKNLCYPELGVSKIKDEKIVDPSVANIVVLSDKTISEKENNMGIPFENVPDGKTSQISEVVQSSLKSNNLRAETLEKKTTPSPLLMLVTDKNFINDRNIRENDKIIDVKERGDNAIRNNKINGDNTVKYNLSIGNTSKESSNIKNNLVSDISTNSNKLIVTPDKMTVGIVTSQISPLSILPEILPSTTSITQHPTSIQNLILPDKPQVLIQPQLKKNMGNPVEQKNSVPFTTPLITSPPINVSAIVQQTNLNQLSSQDTTYNANKGVIQQTNPNPLSPQDTIYNTNKGVIGQTNPISTQDTTNNANKGVIKQTNLNPSTPQDTIYNTTKGIIQQTHLNPLSSQNTAYNTTKGIVSQTNPNPLSPQVTTYNTNKGVIQQTNPNLLSPQDNTYNTKGITQQTNLNLLSSQDTAYNATKGISQQTNPTPLSPQDTTFITTNGITQNLNQSNQTKSNKSSNISVSNIPFAEKPFSTNSFPVPTQKPKNLTTFGLPNGWEKAINHETGRIYYKDHNTATTHWELPTEVQQQMLTKPPPKKESDVVKILPVVPSNVSHKSAESKIKRSLSSPNLNEVGDDQSLKSLPVINRSSKPLEPVPVLVDRTTKPVSSSRLEKLAPIYGSIGRVLTGLKNLGNTCYMNSVIQCLACTLPLGHYFTSGLYEKHLNLRNTNAHPGELARELAFLIIVISAGEYRSVSPIDFKFALGKFAPDFNGFNQQDAHELLMFFMDGLHEDVNKIVKKEIIKVKDTDDLSDEIAADVAWKDYKLNNDSVIVDLFQGQFRSTVTCLSCNKRSKTFDAFNCLQLPLPSNQSTSLESCIQTFTKAERIGGNDSWKCSNCKRYREASKTIEIWKLPPVLIIQLKRFHFDGRWHNKIQTMVNFPMQNFNMSKYIVAPQSKYTKYHLYAVINHYGSFESGHYTASCVNPYYEKWYNFDDSIVKEVDESSIKTNNAYLLFYTAVDFKEYIKR